MDGGRKGLLFRSVCRGARCCVGLINLIAPLTGQRVGIELPLVGNLSDCSCDKNWQVNSGRGVSLTVDDVMRA